MKRPTRRAVLIGTTTVIATGAMASVLACRSGADLATASLDRLRVVLTDIHAPERVGPAYRRGKDRDALLAEFEARPGLREIAQYHCPATARAALRAEVARDFRSGDLIIADRLVMARSECILAALAT